MVATFTNEGLSQRAHAVQLLGLGAEVAARGSLGPELVGSTAALVTTMVELARADGAERVGIVATEAVRNAADSSELSHAVFERCGERVRILAGEQEARLSYLGATAFKVPPGQAASVVDIGGGSTEVVNGLGTRPGAATSLKLGSDRILNLIRASDPPTPRQLADAEARISMVLETLAQAEMSGSLIATGGTAANLPVLLGLRPAPDEGKLELQTESGEAWTNLQRAQVEAAAVTLAGEPSASVAERTGLSPRRARLMCGGVAILLGLLERSGVPEVTVTERGLRDGVVLAIGVTAEPSAAGGVTVT